ncbi:hypothetical protein FACS189430_02410 [Bacteroidia bacterium]|nr:hypothetical protein FACS189430_02410 [Bacteroidia bacterium]
MKKTRKMHLKLAIMLTISHLSVTAIEASQTISVSHQACRYELQIPDGWDTIPQKALKEKMKQYSVDWGIYPVSQEGFFSGRYALIGFIPTAGTLNQFTPEQIAGNISKFNQQSEITNDSLQLKYENMTVANYRVLSYFAIRKNADTLRNCQLMYFSKFGYVSVLYYDKNKPPIKELPDDLSNIIEIQQDYRYAEPAKSGISFKNILISLLLGVLVYAVIMLFQKRKKPSV